MPVGKRILTGDYPLIPFRAHLQLEQLDALRKLGEIQPLSLSEHIRRAVADYLIKHNAKAPELIKK